jgi:predicted nuclease of predicted toxin-antitoxin system
MKILIDENLPVKLKYRLTDFDICTVHDMKWDSYKNGELISEAIKNKFDVLLTSDKNLEFQQNISKLNISIIVLDIPLLKWTYIEPLLTKIKKQLSSIEPGEIYSIR